MVKFVEPDETSPGFTTVIATFPALPVKWGGTVARNCVAAAKVVDSGNLFHSTVDPGANPVPLTLSVNAAPAVIEPGFRVAMPGAGVGAPIEMLKAPELTLPGLT